MIQRSSESKNKPFERFYEKYNVEVVRYLSGKCASKQDAEDLTAQVFEYCYRQYERYDSSKASEVSWLYMIVRSRLKNYYRDRKINANFDDLDNYIKCDDDELEQAMILSELRNRLAEALKSLGETDRRIVILRYFKGKDISFISAQLKISNGAVRTRLSRALSKMEIQLKGIC